MSTIYYLPSHEYVTVEGDIAAVGISEYAAKELGAVTYVDMPEEGDEIVAGEEFGAIESRKAASDLFAPVSGEVIEVNTDLEDDPRLINNAPLDAWIIKVRMSNPAELEKLMNQEAYDKFLAGLKH